MFGMFVVSAAMAATAADVSRAEAIPYFARKYGVSCQQCHVAPPKLNAFGERFVAAGYRGPGLTARRTVPLALWVSGRSESLPGGQTSDAYRGYANRIELISGGALTDWLSYFVEWRPLSLESRGNGTLRDRSGRFEDLFLTLSHGAVEVTGGQFRQLGQIDVSRRLGLSEPLVFSSSLRGRGGGTSREIALRAFSPAGRSPALRASIARGDVSRLRWTGSVALPIAGEFSLPLSDSARVQASNEIEWRAKGIFVESYARRDLWSIGAHLFYDDSRRYLAQAVGTGSSGSLYLTAVGGLAQAGRVTRGRWSVEGEFVPRSFAALGMRVEDQAADGQPEAILPFVNLHFPGTRYTIRLTLERRFQRDRNATFLEVGGIF
ncbi:MAG: hypothetical protein ACT4O1_00310 [Gemmatimonadota bacterium]